MDQSQRREFSSGLFHRSHGSFELVLSPVLLSLLGLWIDARLGTTPVLCVVLAVVGFTGAAVKLYYSYREGMAQHAARVREARVTPVTTGGERAA